MPSGITAVQAPASLAMQPPSTSGGVSAPVAAPTLPAPHASPVSLLDPSTGLVVLEFYNARGQETSSLPTHKQLELYRLNEPSPDVFTPAIRDPLKLPNTDDKGLATQA